MVTDFILGTLLAFVRALFTLLPTWGVDTSGYAAVENMAVSAGSLDGWLPEQFIITCLLVLIGARLWFMVINGLQWLYHLIPFNGGS